MNLKALLLSLMAIIIISAFSSASLVYNDPEVFWVKANAAFFTDPVNHQQISIARLSNDQLRIYLRDNKVREQVGLETTEIKMPILQRNKGPALLQHYQRFVTQKDLDYVRNNFDRILDPNQNQLEVKKLSDTGLRSLLYYPAVRNQLGLDTTKSEYLKQGQSNTYEKRDYLVTPEQINYIKQHFTKIFDPNLQREMLVSDLTNTQLAKLLQDQGVRQATGIDEAFPARLPQSYGPIRVPAPYVQSYRIAPGSYDTEWVYGQTQRLYDSALHKNYRSDYYGDENLNDMLQNKRIRYQPWGTEKYYD